MKCNGGHPSCFTSLVIAERLWANPKGRAEQALDGLFCCQNQLAERIIMYMKMKIVLSILFPVSLLLVPLLANAATHTAGTNVLNNGTIYMVTSDGQLRPYTSAGAFLSYGFNSWGDVQQANSDDLALPTGAFIPPRDGTIMCSDRGSDKGTCYLITDGQKAAFTSESVFSQSGFNFKYALYGDVSFLPTAPNISSSTRPHLPGTLINNNGTIELVGTNGTIGVPSMDTLQSWGYSLVNVVNANTADQAFTQTAVLTPHVPGQLTYNTTTNNPVSPTPIPSSSATPTLVPNVAPTIVPTVIPALLPAYTASTAPFNLSEVGVMEAANDPLFGTSPSYTSQFMVSCYDAYSDAVQALVPNAIFQFNFNDGYGWQTGCTTAVGSNGYLAPFTDSTVHDYTHPLSPNTTYQYAIIYSEPGRQNSTFYESFTTPSN